MAIIEKSTLFRCKDSSGNETLLYPVTVADNVDGLDKALAGSAVKLNETRLIDGVSFDGSSDITHYTVCSTPANILEKSVSCQGFIPAEGAEITIKFDNNVAGITPTLNVNETGAKPIFFRGSYAKSGLLIANGVYKFVYDGNNYNLIGDIDTTYSNATTSKSGLMSADDKKKVDDVYSICNDLEREVLGYTNGFLAKYIKIVFGDVYSNGASEKSVSVAEVRVFDKNEDAIAIESVSADSALNATYTVDKVIDGKLDTFWISARQDQTHYLILELKTAANVNSLSIIPRPDDSYHRIDSFTVMVSEDNSNWQEVGSFENLKTSWTIDTWKKFALTSTQSVVNSIRYDLERIKTAVENARTIPVVKTGDWDYSGLPVTETPKEATYGNDSDSAFQVFPKYALLGQNFFPSNASYSKTMPYNGITLSKNGRVIHVDGAATSNVTVTLLVDNSQYIPLPSNVKPGDAIVLRTFLVGETTNKNIYITLQFYDSSKTRISYVNHFCGTNATDVKTRVVIPSNTESIVIWFCVKSPNSETHNADVCTAMYVESEEIQYGTDSISKSAENISFFPTPASSLSYRVSIKEYIDSQLRN